MAIELPTLTRESIIQRLRDAGHKVTPQRLTICEFIMNRKDHPNAERVFDEIKKIHPAISRATIYNTLHVMRDVGLVQELGFDDGTTRYEPDIEFHINQVCQACGKISDIKDRDVESAWHHMLASNSIKPKGQRLDVYYECDACKARRHKDT
ncbi:MAG: transcriptional repressor [Candidatus Lokiarchaeota archaeon]|nr:transcriptional repressor [Candidatus Lokiarchaeota archaeon]